MKHTQGPWVFKKDERLGESGNKHADLWIIESKSRKAMAILEVWELNRSPKWRSENPEKIKEHSDTIAEVEANARLIASAPELLDALEACLVYMDGFTQRAAGKSTVIEQARAALAKAIGD